MRETHSASGATTDISLLLPDLKAASRFDPGERGCRGRMAGVLLDPEMDILPLPGRVLPERRATLMIAAHRQPGLWGCPGWLEETTMR